MMSAFRLICVWICTAVSPAALLANDEALNVLLICIDDLRPELHCFGVEYIQSPNIDRLAAQGIRFTRHYVQAPTCGASRYALLTGCYGAPGNGALFERAKRMTSNPGQVSPSLPEWFRQHGYTCVSVGKVSHHPGGRGGPDWNQDDQPEMPNAWNRHLLNAGPWQHPRGFMHGLANGEIRTNPAEMAVFQAAEGADEIYPDGLTIRESLRQLEQLAANSQPFFLAVGIVRPHLPFGAPARYLEPYRNTVLPPIPHPERPEGRTTWHASGEFRRYNLGGCDPNSDAEFATEVRRHYAACVSYADALTGEILDQLEAVGVADKTIVVLWGDHGWHLGEHAIWGKHSLFEESLRAPLVVKYPSQTNAGEASAAIVETIDIFPTLCDLANLPMPDFVDGVSLRTQLEGPESPSGRAAISYAQGSTIRTDTHRFIVHADGYRELYDHRTPSGETNNIAAVEPELADELENRLRSRLERHERD